MGEMVLVGGLHFIPAGIFGVILSRRCPLLATSCPSFFCLLSMLISDSRFDLVWFRLSCDHGWIRSGSVNVRKQQQQQQQHTLSLLFSSQAAHDHATEDTHKYRKHTHLYTLNVDTVYKPRQGGTNFVPL